MNRGDSLSLLVTAALLAGSTAGVTAERQDPADELYQRGERNVAEGNQQAAIVKFRAVARSYPKSSFASHAQLQIAELLSRNREYVEAFEACQRLMEKFPESGDFARALEIQFSIAERVMQEYRQRRGKGDKSTRGLPDRETASGMLRAIVANGRFSEQAPRAQFRLAVTLDEEGKPRDATREFNHFIEDYPQHALAADAAFQAGFIDYRIAREQNHERAAQQRARMALDYFLVRYPESEKAPEARHLVSVLSGWESERLATAGGYYARTGRSESALKTLGDALGNATDPEATERIKKQIDKAFRSSPAPAAP